jgi:hypothetical protein
MPTVRIEHSVSNFEEWKRTFDGDPADRKGSGVRRYQVLRSKDDPHLVMIDLEFDTAPRAEAFLHAMETLWAGPAKAIIRTPRARVFDVVELKSLI